MRLSGRVALVLPGSYGIGHAASVRFAKEGARVLVAGWDESNGAKTVDAVVRAGGAAEFMKCDLLREGDVQAVVDGALQRFGGLDAVFGCPDYYLHGLIADQPSAWLDYSLAHNTRSLFFLAKYAIPAMAARGGGAVVFLTSMYARVAGAASCAYEISKGAVINMTHALADRYASKRVRVNCIAAGHVIEGPTDLVDETRHTYLVREEASVVRLSQYYPAGRLALPDEIARVAAFLASDDAAFVTGATLAADGGFCVR